MPAYLIAGVMWMPIPIVAGFIALATPALNLNVPAADMVGPMIAARILGVGGAILVFIVVFSALASSLDSLLAATGDLITQDIYKGHINPDASHDKLRMVAKLIILLLGVMTWLVCLPRVTTLAILLYYIGAWVASTIWPILAGLYWKRTNPIGASLAMVLGTILGQIAFFAIGFYVAAIVSALVSMLTIIVTTLLWPKQFEWHMLSGEGPR